VSRAVNFTSDAAGAAAQRRSIPTTHLDFSIERVLRNTRSIELSVYTYLYDNQYKFRLPIILIAALVPEAIRSASGAFYE